MFSNARISMSSKVIKSINLLMLSASATMLAASILVSGSASRLANAETSNSVAPVQANAPAVATVDVSCTPIQIATFKERIHVRCSESFSGITYFAVGASDAQYTARVLSIMSAAYISGKKIGVRYDPADASGAAIGCLVADCRLAAGVWY